MANLSSTRIFGDASVERSLYVKQRLGIGVGNPSAKLDVGGIVRVVPGDDQPLKIQSGTSGDEITMGGNEIDSSVDLYIQNDTGNETYFTGGSVGINTSSPGARLDVNGNMKLSNNGGEIIEFITEDDNHCGINFRADGSENIVSFEHYTNGTDYLTVDYNNNGNVGIGTNSPNQKLDVEGAADLNGRLNMRGNDIHNVRQIDGSNGNHRIRFDDNNSYIEFSDQSNNRRQVVARDVYIDEDNYWIGDLNLEGHVNNDDAHHPDHRDGVDFIDFDNDERSDHDGQDGRLFWDLSEGLYISSSNSKTGSTSVLQWSRSNVTAGSNVSVNYDSRGRPTISASGGGNTYTDSDAIDAIESNSNKLNMSAGIDIQSNGNIDSVNKLNVSTIDSNNGNGHIDWKQPVHFNGNGGNNESYEVRISGKGLRVDDSVRATGDVIAFYSSDRRLKNDPTQIQNPLSEISKLTGVGFGWKEKASREGKGFGVFAHDAKSIDERLVRKQGDGYLGVDYQQLHGIEIEALKQVNEKVEENQSEIQRLKQRIAKLESNDNAI